MKKVFTIFAIFTIILGTYAQDIQSNTAGFSLSIHGSYARWNSESFFLGSLDEEEPNGFGINIKGAYGITQNIEVFIAYTSRTFKLQEDWDSYRNQTFDIGGRYNFGATLRRFRPFAEVALTTNSFTIDPITFDSINLFKLEVNGLGGTIGGGAHYFFTPALSATLNARASFGNFSEILLSGDEVTGLDEDVGFELYIVQIGMSYFFQ